MYTGVSPVLSACKNAPPISMTAVLLPSFAAIASTPKTLQVGAVGADSRQVLVQGTVLRVIVSKFFWSVCYNLAIGYTDRNIIVL